MNQLFLANNDVVGLDRIENEYCQTSRCKWGGVIMKINNKKVSTVLIEFSSGTTVNATINKETSDISKLYYNMMNIIADLPASIPKKTFCARFYGNQIVISITCQHNELIMFIFN
jgi:hypothetical protein